MTLCHFLSMIEGFDKLVIQTCECAVYSFYCSVPLKEFKTSNSAVESLYPHHGGFFVGARKLTFSLTLIIKVIE